MSEFASCLTTLIDDLGYFDRSGWAAFLCVPVESVEAWLTDRAVPRADLLRMVLDAVTLYRPEAPEIAAFYQMAARPSHEVSPSDHLQPTVAEYIRTSSLVSLGHALRGLSSEERVRVLREGSWPV